jgi:hypothetical protein
MSRLRTAAAVLILGILAVLGARLLPLYLDNMRLQSYVEGMAQNGDTRTRPDEALRIAVLEKAASLGLPIKADNVHIKRSGDNTRIDVRYIVRVDFPLYTVDLHFYPGSH